MIETASQSNMKRALAALKSIFLVGSKNTLKKDGEHQEGRNCVLSYGHSQCQHMVGFW